MKRIIAVLFTIAMSIVLAACSDTVRAASAAEDYLTRDYEEAVMELRDAGFTNIETIADEDLTSTTLINDGLVKEISIDGNTGFEAGTRFAPEVPVVITYHTIKKLRVPLRADELQSFDYETLADYFIYAGFTNVDMQEVNDLDPDEMEAEYVNEVLINGSNEFSDTDRLPFDAEIKIICHLPYEKYNLRLDVSCKGNLLFSKYDVDVYVDEEKLGTVKHGTAEEYEFVVRDGQHTFVFMKADSVTVKKEVTMDVQNHKALSFELTCRNDTIDAEMLSDTEWRQISEHEVEMKFSSSDYHKKNYEELAAALKDLGFTNIKTEPQYDILLILLTKDGELSQITIDGKKGFEKGDIFEKNAQIIIKYHALKESQKR